MNLIEKKPKKEDKDKDKDNGNLFWSFVIFIFLINKYYINVNIRQFYYYPLTNLTET